MSSLFFAGDFWVSTLTLRISQDSDEWYGRWWIYNRRPDLKENAGMHSMAEGTTDVYASECDADRAVEKEGRRRALIMTR
ncbi:hypothetical protein DyAD56_18965 [Dyella sp. AD56]|nr:hypothetical protein DyAD56_18965 [Dyella sp. AD56]